QAKQVTQIDQQIMKAENDLRYRKATDADHKYLSGLRKQKEDAEAVLKDSFAAAQKATVAKIMANDIKDDFMSTVNGIRNLVSKHIPKSNKSKPQEGES